jgi:hypothetical protein
MLQLNLMTNVIWISPKASTPFALIGRAQGSNPTSNEKKKKKKTKIGTRPAALPATGGMRAQYARTALADQDVDGRDRRRITLCGLRRTAQVRWRDVGRSRQRAEADQQAGIDITVHTWSLVPGRYSNPQVDWIGNRVPLWFVIAWRHLLFMHQFGGLKYLYDWHKALYILAWWIRIVRCLGVGSVMGFAKFGPIGELDAYRC